MFLRRADRIAVARIREERASAAQALLLRAENNARRAAEMAQEMGRNLLQAADEKDLVRRWRELVKTRSALAEARAAEKEARATYEAARPLDTSAVALRPL